MNIKTMEICDFHSDVQNSSLFEGTNSYSWNKGTYTYDRSQTHALRILAY